MLYYIIPPIIIVVSLAILIVFLSRKREDIAREIERNELLNQGVSLTHKGIKHFNRFSLGFLEKLTLKIKLFSLKFHNLNDRWSKAIRKKKALQISQSEKSAPAEDRPESDDIQETIQAVKTERLEELPIQKKVPEEKEEEIIAIRPELLKRIKKAAKPQPIISSRVVKPEPKEEEKREFEKALIERIAMDPRDLEAYERLGDYYVERENNADAAECFRQVLKLSPGSHKARIKLRRLEKILGL